MDELFESEKKVAHPRQVGHLGRRLFLLVLAIALLGQVLMWVDKGLQNYYEQARRAFKIILTVPNLTEKEQIETWTEHLHQDASISSVRFFSSEEALTVVRHKNPQLVESLLLVGANKMPAYFELTLHDAAVNNVESFVAQLMPQYEGLEAHYNAQHAQLLFYLGMYAKLVRLGIAAALLVFIAFMFLVEAAPYEPLHPWGGLLAGLAAGLLSVGLLAVALYPMGFLMQMFIDFTTWPRQALLVVFCGLLGWTLSKWQKF